jgi:hypothetical protein
VALLYTTISLIDPIGGLAGGPLLAASFSAGLKIGGPFTGLPFLFAAGIYFLTGSGIWSLTAP